MATLLLSIETLIALAGFLYIFKRDKFFGTFFFFLFLYGIFAQIGYYYFSILSISLDAYFGRDAWYESTLLIIFSLFLILVIFALFWHKLLKTIPFTVVVRETKNKQISVLALILVFFVLIYQTGYLAIYWNTLSYYYINNLGPEGTQSSLPLFVFGLILKLLVAISFVFYSILRGGRSLIPKVIIRIFCFFSILLLFLCCYKLSNRTDIVALTTGVFVFEFNRQTRIRWKLILKASVLLFFIAIFLFFLRSLRFGNEQEIPLVLSEIILMQDYYPPAHMLFASVAYNYVNPQEVLLSNVNNSLILMNYPFLQHLITNLFQTIDIKRGASYGFYIITEGYVALGKLGFIYNALVLTVMLAIWRKLAASNNILFNSFLIGLMGCMIVNLVRSQSSFFIKNLYMFIFPGTMLYIHLVGLKISLRLKPKRHKGKVVKAYSIVNTE